MNTATVVSIERALFGSGADMPPAAGAGSLVGLVLRLPPGVEVRRGDVLIMPVRGPNRPPCPNCGAAFKSEGCHGGTEWECGTFLSAGPNSVCRLSGKCFASLPAKVGSPAVPRMPERWSEVGDVYG